MSFASEEDLLAFVKTRGQELGLGTPEALAGGGFVFRDGPSADRTAAIERQLLTEVGGPDATVQLAGVPRSLRAPEPEIETRQQAVRSCGGDFCTEDSSFIERAWIGLRTDVGGRTFQVSGGFRYERMTRFGSSTCPDGWELISSYWLGSTRVTECRRGVGYNYLEISNTFYREIEIEGSTYLHIEEGGTAGFENMESVQIGKTFWSAQIDGVCSRHRSEGDGGRSSAVTWAGKVPINCKLGRF